MFNRSKSIWPRSAAVSACAPKADLLISSRKTTKHVSALSLYHKKELKGSFEKRFYSTGSKNGMDSAVVASQSNRSFSINQILSPPSTSSDSTVSALPVGVTEAGEVKLQRDVLCEAASSNFSGRR